MPKGLHSTIGSGSDVTANARQRGGSHTVMGSTNGPVENTQCRTALPLLEVKSSVIVNAPPEKVWRNVVSFSELPPPREFIFKLGVARFEVAIEMRWMHAAVRCPFLHRLGILSDGKF